MLRVILYMFFMATCHLQVYCLVLHFKFIILLSLLYDNVMRFKLIMMKWAGSFGRIEFGAFLIISNRSSSRMVTSVDKGCWCVRAC